MSPPVPARGLLIVLGALLALSGCTEAVRLSRGTRIPDELRGASSAQLTDLFTRVERGSTLSFVATLVDFSYVRAVTREGGRTEEREREAFQRYLRRQTSFYVYLTLHRMETCRDHGSRADEGAAHDGEGGPPVDLRGWRFALADSTGRRWETPRVEPGPTVLAPASGCLLQGWVTFPRGVPPTARWVSLEASAGEGRATTSTAVRWDLEPWTPPRRGEPRRSRRPARAEDHGAPSGLEGPPGAGGSGEDASE